MIEERTRLILEKSIEDFIEDGKPITSERLYERHDFGVKTAMIRRELSCLSQNGFFHQNHPSGGRFPTNKAYRFFVSNILNENLATKNALRFGTRMVKLLELERCNEFAEGLAGYLDLLGAVYDLHEKTFYDSGIDVLFDKVEPEEKRELAIFLRDIERLPERLKKQKDKLEKAEVPNVFIGKSLLTTSSYLSCIVEEINVGEKRAFVIVVGPRRMNYKRSLGFFQAIKNLT